MAVTAFNVTGPVDIYFAFNSLTPIPQIGAAGINPGTGAGAAYLGTAEMAPEPQNQYFWKEIYNSLGGDMVPMDRLYLGEQGLIAMNLNRFSYANAFAILGLGSEDRLDRGSMMVSNGYALQLWLRFSFYGTANALAYPEMPPGYFYWCTQIVSHFPKGLTLDATNLQLIFQCQPVFNPSTRGHDLRSSLAAFFTNLPAPN